MKNLGLLLLIFSTLAFGQRRGAVEQFSTSVNIVENPGGEFGKAKWSTTGSSTLTRSTSTKYLGKSSLLWDATAGAERLEGSLVDIPAALDGIFCEVEFFYSGAGGATITPQVVDGNGLDLTSASPMSITDATDVGRFVRARTGFICPDYQDVDTNKRKLQFRLLSAGDANPIYIDQVSIGYTKAGQGSAGGWKVYDESVVTVTGTGWSTTKGEFIPYKDPVTNKWRLNFNLVGVTSSAARTTYQVTVDGVVFEAGGIQSIAGSSNSAASYVISANPGLGNGDLNISHASSTTSTYSWSGDVALDSKPTWADFDGTVNLLNNSVLKSNAKFKIEGLDTTVIGAALQTIDYKTITDNVGGFTESAGVITIPADGRYKITADVGSTTTFGGATDMIVNLNNSTNEIIKSYIASVTDSLSISSTLKLSAGDQIRIQKNGSAFTGFDAGARSFVTIERLPDITGESAFGFGLADADNAGLSVNIIEAGRKNYVLTDAGSNTNCTELGTNLEWCSNDASTNPIMSEVTPYKKTDGTWWLRFTLSVDQINGVDQDTIAIEGVEFSDFQGVSVTCSDSTTAATNLSPGQGFAQGGSNLIHVSCNGTGRRFRSYSGDRRLTGKPTWAN